MQFFVACLLYCLVIMWVSIDRCFSGDQVIDPSVITNAMISERMGLVSADVRIRGRESRTETYGSKSSRPPSIRAREIDDRIVVDYGKELIRYEHAMTNVSSEMGLAENSQHETIVVGMNRSYRKAVQPKSIVIGERKGMEICWDLRAIGMGSYDDLLNNHWIDIYGLTFQRNISNGRITVAPSDVPGIVIMTMTFSMDPKAPESVGSRRRIWIDERQGYTPVRMEEQSRNNEVDASSELAWTEPYTTVLTEWNKEVDTWVPSTCTITCAMGVPEIGGLQVRYDLSFDWGSVNEELNQVQFELTSLDVPPGSHYINDNTIQPGRSVTVQHPSVPDAKTLQHIQDLAQSPPVAPIIVAEGGLSWQRMLILLNLLFLVVVVFVVFLRRLFRDHHQKSKRQ